MIKTPFTAHQVETRPPRPCPSPGPAVTHDRVEDGQGLRATATACPPGRPRQHLLKSWMALKPRRKKTLRRSLADGAMQRCKRTPDKLNTPVRCKHPSLGDLGWRPGRRKQPPKPCAVTWTRGLPAFARSNLASQATSAFPRADKRARMCAQAMTGRVFHRADG